MVDFLVFSFSLLVAGHFVHFWLASLVIVSGIRHCFFFIIIIGDYYERQTETKIVLIAFVNILATDGRTFYRYYFVCF